MKHQQHLIVGVCLLNLVLASQVQAQNLLSDWKIGAVIDVAATSSTLAVGQRDKGIALGHSDMVIRGPVANQFDALIGVAVHSHDKKYEAELEESWLQTRQLPYGWQARVGRFASQIGYLNEQHPHADDFVERPLLYRTFLGGHWFDDGMRLNWTAPTSMYVGIGAEVFSGKQLVSESTHSSKIGASTFRIKIGDDWSESHSWQAGWSFLSNRRGSMIDEEGHDDHDHHDHHDHAGHSHGAQLSGKKMHMLDLAWKWAPDGNNRQKQVRLVGEIAQISQINQYAQSGEKHQALALSGVWRMSQDWEIGIRADWLKANMPHGDHFHDGQLREQSIMLAYKPSHTQTLRLQLATQNKAKEFEGASHRSVQLQYVISLGAHGAHSY